MCVMWGKKGAHGYLIIIRAEGSRVVSDEQKFVSGVLARKKVLRSGLYFPPPLASK